MVFAAYGEKIRDLKNSFDNKLSLLELFKNPRVAIPGVLVLEGSKFESYGLAQKEFELLDEQIKLRNIDLNGFPLIVIADDAAFTTANLKNWLWTTFTRSNPANDIYGINSKTEFKHFGCDNVIIDARIKPHHAPVLEKDPEIEKRVDKLFEKGGSLSHLKK